MRRPKRVRVRSERKLMIGTRATLTVVPTVPISQEIHSLGMPRRSSCSGMLAGKMVSESEKTRSPHRSQKNMMNRPARV